MYDVSEQRRATRTWRRWLMAACSPVVVVFLMFASATPVLAATVTNLDVPVSGVVVNPCNGENVAFNGVDHVSAQVTNTNSGYHVAIHDNIHVTANGDLGNTYVGNQEDYSNLNLSFTKGAESTSPLSFSEISLGAAPNFLESAVFHITFNAAGVLTAYVTNFTTSCLG